MSLARSAATGAKWAVVSVAGRHAVVFLTSLALARLLSPADFGLVAMAAVFTRFIELIRDMGTGAAIVRVDSPSSRLLSSVFWLNMGLGLCASAGLAIAAPLAAVLFREPRLTPILRLLSVSPLIAAVAIVPTSLLTRDLNFRRLAIIDLTGTAVGAAAALVLALRGFGVWSLAWQSIGAVIAVSAGSWFGSGWRPQFSFQISSVRGLLGYSANLTGFNVLNYLVRYSDNFLIGRYLGAADLGVYDLAYRLMLLPLQYVSSAVGRALFPVYVLMNEDPRRLKEAHLRATAAIALIAFPVFFGVAAIAEPLVTTVFGAKWARATPLLLVFGPLGALQAISSSANNLYQALGRTDLLFRVTAISGTLTIGAFIIGLRWGVIGVAIAYAVVSLLLAYPVMRIPLRLIDIHPKELIVRAIARPLLCSLTMVAALAVVGRTWPAPAGGPARLFALLVVAVAVYAATTMLFNRHATHEVIEAARRA